jgi:hypothetical protein
MNVLMKSKLNPYMKQLQGMGKSLSGLDAKLTHYSRIPPKILQELCLTPQPIPEHWLRSPGLGGDILKGNAPFARGPGALMRREACLEPQWGHEGISSDPCINSSNSA